MDKQEAGFSIEPFNMNDERREGQDDRKQKRAAAAASEADRAAAVKAQHREFYCAVCDKQRAGGAGTRPRRASGGGTSFETDGIGRGRRRPAQVHDRDRVLRAPLVLRPPPPQALRGDEGGGARARARARTAGQHASPWAP